MKTGPGLPKTGSGTGRDELNYNRYFLDNQLNIVWFAPHLVQG